MLHVFTMHGLTAGVATNLENVVVIGIWEYSFVFQFFLLQYVIDYIQYIFVLVYHLSFLINYIK